jgi:hypothetical protein
MDELLLSRVEQLQEIDKRLEEILAKVPGRVGNTYVKLRLLRDDVARMIREAQAEYDAF